MCVYAQLSDCAVPEIAVSARHFVTDMVQHVLGERPSGIADDIAVVVSELTTNSINAHAPTITLDLTVHRDHVRIAVTDDVSGTPHVERPQTTDEHGRGLLIVETLTREWGTTYLVGGKQTWAVVPVDGSTLGLDRCAVLLGA